MFALCALCVCVCVLRIFICEACRDINCPSVNPGRSSCPRQGSLQGKHVSPGEVVNWVEGKINLPTHCATTVVILTEDDCSNFLCISLYSAYQYRCGSLLTNTRTI